MWKFASAVLLILALTPGDAGGSAVYMPDPASIVAFWPLDALHGLQDVSGLKRPVSLRRGVLNTFFQGPFGINETSLTADTSKGQGFLFESRFPAPTLSFSISFAFFANETDCGIATTAMTCNGLSIHYSANTSSIALSTSSYPAEVIANYRIVKKQAWNLLTIAYDASNYQLFIYGRDNLVAYSPFEPKIAQTTRFDNGILAGFSCTEGHSYFAPDAAISCLAIHNRAMKLEESRQVFEACRKFHNRHADNLKTQPLRSPPLDKHFAEQHK